MIKLKKAIMVFFIVILGNFFHSTLAKEEAERNEPESYEIGEIFSRKIRVPRQFELIPCHLENGVYSIREEIFGKYLSQGNKDDPESIGFHRFQSRFLWEVENQPSLHNNVILLKNATNGLLKSRILRSDFHQFYLGSEFVFFPRIGPHLKGVFREDKKDAQKIMVHCFKDRVYLSTFEKGLWLNKSLYDSNLHFKSLKQPVSGYMVEQID